MGLWWPVLISGFDVYLTLPPYRYVGDYATYWFLLSASSGVVRTGLGAYLVDGGTVCSCASACAFTTTERALTSVVTIHINLLHLRYSGDMGCRLPNALACCDQKSPGISTGALV